MISLEDTVTAVENKEQESRDEQKNKHEEVETVDDVKLDAGLQENINIGAQYGDHSRQILDTLAKFQEIWNGRLGRIDMAKQGIKRITLDIHPITPPYTTTDRKHPIYRRWKSAKCFT